MRLVTQKDKEKLFSDVWQRKQPHLIALCLGKLPDAPAEIEDILSDTAGQLWSEMRASSGKENWGKRCTQIAYNILRRKETELKRKRKYELSLSCVMPGLDALRLEYDYGNPPDGIREGQIRERVLESFNEREAELFRMIYEEKLKYKDIARRLNISEGAVKQKNFRLRRKAERLISRELEEG